MNYLILVDGLIYNGNGGKSTFVETLCGELYGLIFNDGKVITIDLDDPAWKDKSKMYGCLFTDLGVDKLFILNLPDARPYHDFWPTVLLGDYYKLMGAIVMIDSEMPVTIRHAISLAQTYRAYAFEPALYAVGNQDSPNAQTLEEIQMLFNLETHPGDEISLLPCDATDLESVKSAIIRLLQEYLATIQR